MLFHDFNLLKKLSRFGVSRRNDLKNDLALLKKFLRRRWVVQVFKNGKVYYQLTEKSLGLLEEYRQELWHQARLGAMLYPNSNAYRALVEDLRFLDEKHVVAKEFLFLGDWQLKRPVVASQLALAQQRYYQRQG